VTQAIVHGTAITLTFLTGALLSSHAEAVTIVMQGECPKFCVI